MVLQVEIEMINSVWYGNAIVMRIHGKCKGKDENTGGYRLPSDLSSRSFASFILLAKYGEPPLSG